MCIGYMQILYRGPTHAQIGVSAGKKGKPWNQLSANMKADCMLNKHLNLKIRKDT